MVLNTDNSIRSKVTYHRHEVAAVLQRELDESLPAGEVDLVAARLRHQLLLLAPDEDQNRAVALEVVVASGRAGVDASQEEEQLRRKGFLGLLSTTRAGELCAAVLTSLTIGTRKSTDAARSLLSPVNFSLIIPQQSVMVRT